MRSIIAALWALVGAFVLVFLAFALLAGVTPASAKVAMIVAAVAAVLWVLHALPRFTSRDTAHIDPSDRERRGF